MNHIQDIESKKQRLLGEEIGVKVITFVAQEEKKRKKLLFII